MSSRGPGQSRCRRPTSWRPGPCPSRIGRGQGILPGGLAKYNVSDPPGADCRSLAPRSGEGPKITARKKSRSDRTFPGVPPLPWQPESFGPTGLARGFVLKKAGQTGFFRMPPLPWHPESFGLTGSALSTSSRQSGEVVCRKGERGGRARQPARPLAVESNGRNRSDSSPVGWLVASVFDAVFDSQTHERSKEPTFETFFRFQSCLAYGRV